jgi:hypothetical protein
VEAHALGQSCRSTPDLSNMYINRQASQTMQVTHRTQDPRGTSIKESIQCVVHGYGFV